MLFDLFFHLLLYQNHIMNVRIFVAETNHIIHTQKICDLIYLSAQQRGTGIATRSPEYIAEKIQSGKAVIALDGDKAVGFSYIETWSHGLFVANSGLIVAHDYRNRGLARRIKRAIFGLSRTLFPNAKIFSITTGLAVMKLNTELGYRPVPFSELTDDSDFWDGCQGCKNYDILERNDRAICLCTGMLYDPDLHPESAQTPLPHQADMKSAPTSKHNT